MIRGGAPCTYIFTASGSESGQVDPADNRGNNTVQLDPVFSHTSRPLLGKIEPASFEDKLPIGLIMFMQGEVRVKQNEGLFLLCTYDN
jgi:hypothetical protein